MNAIDRLTTFWNSEAVLDLSPALVADVLALVEIARAAQGAKDFLETVAAEEDNPVHDVYAALRAALARLDTEEAAQ